MVDEGESMILKQIVVGGQQENAGTNGRWSYFQARTNVKLGNFYNASKSYMDLDSTGSVTGLMSAHNMEIRFPLTPMSAGTYCCAEHEVVMQASTTLGGTSGTSFSYYRLSGDSTAVGDFNDTAFFFNIQGLSEGTGNIFSAGAGALTTAGTLKIIVGSTTYYIMLASNEAN